MEPLVWTVLGLERAFEELSKSVSHSGALEEEDCSVKFRARNTF